MGCSSLHVLYIASPVQNSTKRQKIFTFKRKLNWYRPKYFIYRKTCFVVLNLVSKIVKFSFLGAYIFVILIGREFQVGVSNTIHVFPKHGGHMFHTQTGNTTPGKYPVCLSLYPILGGGEKTHFLLHKSCITPTFLKRLENM
jgi:hypothetical protein